MTESNILITGGAGFIGRHLVEALAVDQDLRIWVLDSLHPQVHGPEASDPVFPDNVNFVRGDVCDAPLLADLCREARPAVVYHLAAETGTGQSYDEVSRYCEVNVVGTANLIAAIRKVASVRRVVLSASRAVYGEGGYRDATGAVFVGLPRSPEAMQAGDFSVKLPSTAKEPFVAIPSSADLPPAPASVYASTKLMQEYLLCQAGQGAHWQATLLRLQNVYGPGQSLGNPYTGVLTIFARILLEGGRLSIFEDGRISRDFVFIEDVVDAFVRAGQRDVVHGTIVDIGTGRTTYIFDVARILMDLLGIPEDFCSITGQFRVGDIRHACADIRAAGEKFGWTPMTDVQVGMEKLVRWVRTQFPSATPH